MSIISENDSVVVDNLAFEILGHLGLCGYGIEFGNWYGFTGLPDDYGLSKFSEITEHKSDQELFSFSAIVKLPWLHTIVRYQTRYDGTLHTRFELDALENSLIGDIVVHTRFDIGAQDARFNDEPLRVHRRYHYSQSATNKLEIDGNAFEIHCELNKPDYVSMDTVPYAARLDDGSIRYHSRGLCMGGAGNLALLRSRGAMSCFCLGRFNVLHTPFLYRVERLSPALLRNTQICAVAELRRGDSITLSQELRLP